MPECQKIKNGGLDKYGPEHVEVRPYDTTGLERTLMEVTQSDFNNISKMPSEELLAISRNRSQNKTEFDIIGDL